MAVAVPNSPRLGLESESYAQIIISSNDDASGVLQLSPKTLTVAEGVDVPQLRVVRSGGTFGEVSRHHFRNASLPFTGMNEFWIASQQWL